MPHPLTILYDGWSLVYQPNSPEALHLLGILASLPGEVQVILALPGEPPAWIPDGVSRHILQTDDMPRSRLIWEQRTLPTLRQRLGAALLHLTTSNPPLFGPPQNVVSPTLFEATPRMRSLHARGLTERLRSAASLGGMARLGGLFWPDDLPAPQVNRPVFRLPPMVFPTFPADEAPPEATRTEALDLPESFVLYHGPSSEGALRLLLGAWSWAAGPLGDVYPLVALGLDPARREQLSRLAAAYGLGDTVRSLPPQSPAALAGVYRRSAALFHPAEEPPWGGPLRLALASGTPVISIENERSDALAGPAAYLVKGEDSRLLGAALITVLVEEGIAGQLAQAGRQRADAWSQQAFAEGLAKAYATITN